MSARGTAALLFAATVSGCSALTPFSTGPLADPKAKDPGPRVAICYNPLKTADEKVQQLGQAQCSGDTTAQLVSTDYHLDDCPMLTPARATFVCKPQPKSATPPAAPGSPAPKGK
jgi:hypothetical protein